MGDGRAFRTSRRPGVRRVVAMEIVSGIGDGIFWVGLVTALLDLGSGPAGFASAALARLGPRALMSLHAGVIADRVDRRKLLVVLDVTRGLLMMGLAVLFATAASIPWLVFVVAIAYTLAAPYRPALTAALPFIAGERDLSATNALIGTIRQLTTFVGLVVGTAVIEWASPSVAFVINGASFLCAGFLVAGLTGLPGGRHRSPQVDDRAGTWRRDLRHGWHDVAGVAGLRVVTALVFAMYFARGAEIVLHVLIAEERLGLGAPGVGLLGAAVALGALSALPFAGQIAQSNRPALAVALSMASTAGPLGLLAVVDGTVLVCLGLFVVGAGVVVFEVMSVVLLQRLARLETLGRVFGLVNGAGNAGKLAGALSAPVVVTAAGLGAALALTGLAVGAAGLAAIPGLVTLGRASIARREQLRPTVDALAALALFESAAVPALERIAASLTVATVAPGEQVVRQDDPADDLYVIRSGTFRVFDGDMLINTMVAGDWFGEIGLLERRSRTASVVAADAATVWRIPGDTFLRALQESAAPPSAMIDAMNDRLGRSASASATRATGAG